MIRALLLLSFAASCSAFVLPFQVAAAATNITKGGQTLEQTSTYFVANLTIGTPGQLFTVVIDTKTSDLVFPDVTCTTEFNCYNKRKFNSSLSSSYYDGYGQPARFRNRMGNFTGFIGNDRVVIGDRPTDLITIPHLKFLQVTGLPIGIEGVDADGVLGMAFTSGSQIGGNSPFVQAVAEGDISDTFFSIWLEHFNQTNDLGTHGVIYYGGLDPVHCAPNAQYIPLSSGNYYQVTVSGVKSVGSAATNNNNKYIQATIDSTDGNIAAPSTYLSQILDSIGMNINNVLVYPPLVPCDTKISITLSFVSGTTATITERDLVTNRYGDCRLAIVPSNNGQINLGIPFLRGRCTYFDPILERIGVTPALLQD